MRSACPWNAGLREYSRILRLCFFVLFLFFGLVDAYAAFAPGELIVRLSRAPRRDALDGVAESRVHSLDSLIVAQKATVTAPYSRFARRFPSMQPVVLVRAETDVNLDSLEILLNADPNVRWVTRNYLYHPNDFDPDSPDEGFVPNDSLYSQEWWLERISAPLAWEIAHGDSNVVIGFIDTGVDYLHPDLRANIWFNTAETNGLPGVDDDNNGFVDDSVGWDFVDSPSLPSSGDHMVRDSDPSDELGHGTYVAGIAAAVTNNDRCVASVGYNYCRIMCLRAGNAEGLLEEDDIAAAILYGAQMGARILNMSFGDVVSSPLIHDAVQLAAQAGVVMVASAGNANSQSIHYPSGYPEVIACGATNEIDHRTSFSNYGPSVDVMAPGYDIVSTIAGGDCGEWSNPHGTSYSAPMVAAVAGMMIRVNPDLTPEDIKQMIRSTADDIGEPGWDPETVNGRLNARRAVEQAAFGSSVVARIVSPHTDDGFAQDFDVYGDAWGGAFSDWDFYYGFGENPQVWQHLNSGSQRIYRGLLGSIQLPAADTIMVLRLEANGFEGSQSVDHVHLYIQHSSPTLDSLKRQLMLDRDGYAERVQVWTNQVSRASTLLTNSIGDSVRDDFGYVSDEHVTSLSQFDYPGRWSARIRLVNAADLETISLPYDFEITQPSFSSNLWTTTYTSLPHGYLGPFYSDMNRNGRPEVWILPIGEGGLLSDMQVYEWTGTEFVTLPYTFGIHLPQAVGDADEDGLLEFMARRSSLTRIWEQHDPQGLPDPNNDLVFEDTSNFIGAAFIDLDPADNHGEIIARQNTNTINNNRPRYVIFAVGEGYSLSAIDTVPNETEGGNDLGPPKILCGDLDGDSKLDFLYGDYDGDIVFCERDGNRTVQKWSYRLPLDDATNWLAKGDLDGDGQTEFVAGCRSNAFGGSESQRKNRYWAYFIFERTGDNQFEAADSIFILGNEDVSLHPASVTCGDLDADGRDDILISAFPDYYIISYNPATGRYEPRWYATPSESNTTLIADWDQNGVNSAFYGDGTRIVRIDPTSVAGDRPPPPFALSGEPLGPNSVLLSWRAVADADSYRVYRALNFPEFVPIAALVDTQVQIMDATEDVSFTYAVTTVSLSHSNSESVFSNYVVLTANQPPFADDTGKFVAPKFVQISFSEPMESSAFRQRAYRLEDGRMPADVVDAEGGRLVNLTFDGALSAGWHSLILRDVHDAQGTLLPASESPVVFEVVYTEDVFPQILTAGVVGGIPATEIMVSFSEPMSASVLDIQNYRLDEPRRVVQIDSLSAEPQEIRLHIDPRYPIGSIGIIDTLWLSDIMSASNLPLNGSGSAAVLLGSHAASLADAYVFPNPFRGVGPNGGEAGIMFAGLPNKATIRIFTLQGVEIRRIDHSNLIGGTRWDLKNEKGADVAGGVYLYTIEAAGEKVRGKLAVLR